MDIVKKRKSGMSFDTSLFLMITILQKFRNTCMICYKIVKNYDILSVGKKNGGSSHGTKKCLGKI